MITTEGYQLFTYRTSSISLSFALLSMTDNSFHFMATWQTTVSISTLTRVHQTLNTSLDAEFPGFLRIAGGGSLSTPTIQIKTKFLHFVWVAILLITTNAKIKIITNCTMISCLHWLWTSIACVNKFVLTLLIKERKLLPDIWFSKLLPLLECGAHKASPMRSIYIFSKN